MKCDNGDACAGLETLSQDAQATRECAKLIIHFYAQRLKDLRSRMTPAVAPHDFFDCARKRKRFLERRAFALLDNQIGDAPRGRFLPEITEQASEFFPGVVVNDAGCGHNILRIHSHIKRPVSHHAETALRIFELPRRHTKIEKRTSDCRDPNLVKNFVHMTKICPPKGDAPAEPGQSI